MLKNKKILISAICGALLMVAVITLLIINIVLSTKIISSPQGKIYSGEVAQSDAKPGDLFFNTKNYSVYKMNDDGSWTVIGNLTENNDSAVKSINKVSSAGDVDTYEMTFANGSKSSFQIYKNEQVLPQIEILDGFWAIGGVKTNVSATGKGVLKIEFKEAKENTDVYEITYTDNTTGLFEMPKAKNGETPRIGENGNWFIGDTDTGIKAGAGRGIKSINKKSTDGLVDTYEIVFDDDETFEFSVTNAVQEKDITIGENGNWFIGGVDTNIKATGNGIKEISVDDEGLLVITFTDDSVEKYDILSKYFGSNFTVRFHKNGIVLDEDPLDIIEVKVKGGMRIEKPEDPVKKGYHLDGWYNIDGDKWLFGIYTVSFDLDLYAKYEKNDYTITLDPNGGDLSQTSINVKFGDPFTLPEPTLDGYDFNGWYYNNELVTSGNYDYDHDMDLVASFIEKETNTFKINNANDFNKIYENLDKNFILQNDIDLNGATLKPFGDATNPFMGTFDGNGYTISNFVIGESDGDYNGMFVSNAGVIKNIKLENVINNNANDYVSILCGVNNGTITNIEILGDSRIVSKAKYKGLLVALNSSTELFEDILVEGLIEDTNTKKDDFYIGGVIGYSNSNIIIENVTSNVTVNVRLNVDKDIDNDTYNQNTVVGGVIGKSEGSINITKAEFDGKLGVQLSVYCDGLYLETNVGGIFAEGENATLSMVNSFGEINVAIDGLRDGLSTLTETRISNVMNNIGSISAKALSISIDDASMKSVISLNNNLKCAYKAVGEFKSNLFLENNISAIGNKLNSVTANHIYSNISVNNTATLDSNKTASENNNSIDLKNTIAGLFTSAPTVLIDGAIVDIKEFVNEISFVNDSNYTSNNVVRYAFVDVDNQTTNINHGIYKINQNIIDNTVSTKLVNNNDYLNTATVHSLLGYDDTIWLIEEGKLVLKF